MRDRMKSHRLDGFSLIAGLVFLGIGALVLVDASADRDVDPRWVVAALLVGLGLAGVLGSFDWSRTGRSLEHELASEDPVLPQPPTETEER